MQKLLLQEAERPAAPGCHGREVQEGVELREEAAGLRQEQATLRRDKQRWDRQCDARREQEVAQACLLQQRERDCLLLAEQLQQERRELEEQLQEYQLSLERLRQGQQLVELERRELEEQHRLLQSRRYCQSRPLENHQVRLRLATPSNPPNPQVPQSWPRWQC